MKGHNLLQHLICRPSICRFPCGAHLTARVPIDFKQVNINHSLSGGGNRFFYKNLLAKYKEKRGTTKETHKQADMVLPSFHQLVPVLQARKRPVQYRWHEEEFPALHMPSLLVGLAKTKSRNSRPVTNVHRCCAINNSAGLPWMCVNCCRRFIQLSVPALRLKTPAGVRVHVSEAT